jgi:hypothetical protein
MPVKAKTIKKTATKQKSKVPINKKKLAKVAAHSSSDDDDDVDDDDDADDEDFLPQGKKRKASASKKKPAKPLSILAPDKATWEKFLAEFTPAILGQVRHESLLPGQAVEVAVNC